MFDQYTRWAKYEANRHFDKFQKENFYKTVTNSLIAHDFVLKPQIHVRFETCDTFMQGALIPEQDTIILCSNVLSEK